MKVVVIDRPEVYEVIGKEVVELRNHRTVEDVRAMLSYVKDSGAKIIEIHVQVDMNIYIMITIDLEQQGLYRMEEIVCRHLGVK